MKKFIFSFIILTLLTFLTLLPINENAHAETTPTITILGVTEDTKVTFQTHNFPANKVFEVRMGLIGTKGVDGILVGTLDSGGGGSLKFTCAIPADLHDKSSIAIRLESTTGGYYAYNWFSNATFGTHVGGTPINADIAPSPSIIPLSVKEGELVVIKAAGFLQNKDIDIRMGKYGTEGVDGILVKSVNSGEDGGFIEDIEIPEELKSESKVAIRFEVSGDSTAVYTWFENQTGGSGGTSGDNGGTETLTGIPTISILSVDEDKTLTLRTYNFPAGRDFKVLMGKMGTKGVNGIHVTTVNSESGGSFTKTFEIPDDLKGDYRIAIRLQTSDGVFYAYNWFYNNTSSDGSSSDSPASGYTGIPTFSITSVVEDKSVTIKTNNFPAGFDFKVLMGKLGTKGVGGVYVATINSGTGGVLSKTFNIPASLAGEDRIAIRLESASSSFYAYNWFNNNSTP